MTAQIIYLNGPSSSGKTSIARALQDDLKDPYLHIGIDTIIWMMPQKTNNWSGNSDKIGFSWKPSTDKNGNPTQELQVGPYAQKITKAYQEIVILLARLGHNLIIDDVAVGHVDMQLWRHLLQDFSVLYVGVHTPLDILEEREKSRGDRMIGSARDQYFKVHTENTYDVELDTSVYNTAQCVERILEAIKNKNTNTNSHHDIKIRAFNASDIPVIVENFEQANWPKPASTFEQYLEEQSKDERMVWVAHMDSKFAGYVTLKWQSQYPPFALDHIPEIMDLNVLPPFRNLGIGSKLLEIAEQGAMKRSPIIGLGVGLYGGSDGGYGSAQQLYVKRGYIPDGKGVTYGYKSAIPGKNFCLDDDLILWFTKKLGYVS